MKIIFFLFIFLSSLLYSYTSYSPNNGSCDETDTHLDTKYNVCVTDGYHIDGYSSGYPIVRQNNCSSGEVFSETFRTCVSDCTPAPKPDGNIIASFYTVDECLPFQKQNSYDVNNTKYSNLSCWQNVCNDHAMGKVIKLFGVHIPDGFPDSSKKGIRGVYDDNTTSKADCITGAKFDSTIAHVQVLKWNEDKQACEFATFFCDSGLYWDKNSSSCLIPKDNMSYHFNDEDISASLASKCKSNNWAKSWTLDYCNNPLAYIALADQGYNLQGGRKYLEYQCTSDYRIKFYKQVSCGDIAKKDFKKKDLNFGKPNNDKSDSNTDSKNNKDVNISNDSNVTTKMNTDNNTSITDYSAVVKIINGDFKNVDNSLGSLISATSITNQKLSQGNSKLDSINGKLDSANKKLDDLNSKFVPDSNIPLFTDYNNKTMTFLNTAKDSFSTISSDYNRMYTHISKGYTVPVFSTGCSPVFSIPFHGTTLTINLVVFSNNFRGIVYFMFSILFIVMGLKFFWYGFSIGMRF